MRGTLISGPRNAGYGMLLWPRSVLYVLGLDVFNTFWSEVCPFSLWPCLGHGPRKLNGAFGWQVVAEIVCVFVLPSTTSRNLVAMGTDQWASACKFRDIVLAKNVDKQTKQKTN